MSEEEKEAIKYFYNLRATIDESNILFDEDILDYIDDDKIGNKTIIGELKETKQQWLDVKNYLKEKA